MLPYGLGEELRRFGVEHLRAGRFALPIVFQESELELGVDEPVPSQDLPQPAPLFLRFLSLLPFLFIFPLRAAQWKRIISESLLRVVVRADLVDPEAEGLAAVVLVKSFFFVKVEVEGKSLFRSMGSMVFFFAKTSSKLFLPCATSRLRARPS